jgi:GntR family transcriptional regulator
MNARYRELADELRSAVEAGTYPPGSRLPSESELAQTYGAARGTVRQAFAVLAADGLISTRKGARRTVLAQLVGASYSWSVARRPGLKPSSSAPSGSTT